jgi:hypothetical protein
MEPDTMMTDWEKDEQERQERPLNLHQDALALSCASYRRFLETRMRWRELADNVASEQDIALAQEIRKHFQSRIMLFMLTNRRVSDYNRDLYEMLSGVPRQKHMGMLYRLPYLYEEDCQREKLRDQFQPLDPKILPDLCGLHRSQQQLTSVTRIWRSRRNWESREYWFRQQDGYGVCWTVDLNNPLCPLMDGLFDRGSVTICTMLRDRSWRNIQYLYPIEPTLVY